MAEFEKWRDLASLLVNSSGKTAGLRSVSGPSGEIDGLTAQEAQAYVEERRRYEREQVNRSGRVQLDSNLAKTTAESGGGQGGGLSAKGSIGLYRRGA